MGAAQAQSLSWLAAIRQPEQVQAWSLTDWEHVVRLSRRLRLLGRLADSVIGANLLGTVPVPVASQLSAELRFSRWRTQALSWTLERLSTTLADVAYPLVLLKGCAYLGQGLDIASGRLPSDVDILVPQAHIADAQQRLLAAGWEEPELDEHDQRYYHQYSHEVPPMRHPVHSLELDLHHNILPPVARTRVDASLLLARLQPSQWPAWQVLHPHDQVLHSATHLFHDSEARDRLRDLVDLDGLLRHFGQHSDFWSGLPERAAELGLAEPLALACHFLTRWLGTPIPEAALRPIQAQGPSSWRRAWLHPLLEAVLTPTLPDASPLRRQHLASQVLLARYHLARMPLGMLVHHLWHKHRAARRAAVEVAATAKDQR